MAVAPGEALARLREGNQRFVSGVRSLESLLTQTRRDEAQEPFAIVLGCSDARVPAEIIFDQGLGDLFVIRVAGNIVAPSQVGSVEFAAERFGVRLVVVLGHTQCGAILATIDEVRKPTNASPNLRDIVDRIRPSVDTVLGAGLDAGDPRVVGQVVRANVRVSTTHLRHASAALERLIAQERLTVLGAEYALETGEVEFFDGV